VSLAASIILGAILLVAAAGKTRVPSQLRSSTVVGAVVLALVRSLRHTGRILNIVWVAAIGLEVLLGLWLVAGWARAYALTVAAAFFIVALGCVVWALVKAKGSRCGCFGSRAKNSGWVALRCASMASLGAWAGFPAQGSRPGVLQRSAIIVCSGGALAPLLTTSGRRRVLRLLSERLAVASALLRERLSGGPDVSSMTAALAALPYWQDLTERLQLRGPRRAWREGRWVLMEHVPLDTDSRALVVSASCAGTRPLWLRVAVLSAIGDRVEVDSLWDSVAAAADEAMILVKTTEPLEPSRTAVVL
jgi:hypothetical protein